MGRRRKELETVTGLLSLAVDKVPDDEDADPNTISLGAFMGMDSMMVRKTCLAMMRQITRSLLAKRFDPNRDEVDDLGSPVPGLQKRYPRSKRNGEQPRYAPIHRLTEDDKNHVLNLLRRGAHGRLAHIKRFEKWWEEHMESPEDGTEESDQ